MLTGTAQRTVMCCLPLAVHNHVDDQIVLELVEEDDDEEETELKTAAMQPPHCEFYVPSLCAELQFDSPHFT